MNFSIRSSSAVDVQNPFWRWLAGYLSNLPFRCARHWTSSANSRSHVVASFLSAGILSLALTVLWLAHRGVPQWSPPVLEVREIALAPPPPPPPPPPVTEQMTETSTVVVQVPGSGASITLQNLQQKVEITKPSAPQLDIRQTQWQSLDIDWQAFSLNDLDDLPTLLTPLRVNLPKSLSRRGVDHVLLKLDVVIDEQGRLELVNIIENPYAELLPEIQRLVRNSRFSAPQKQGQPVRARFIWPVEIKP